MLTETRMNFQVDSPIEKNGLLFTDFMKEWLKSIKPNIELSTYASYEYNINQLCRYFDKKKSILLKDLEAKDIQDFYTYAINDMNVSANTVDLSQNLHTT